MFTPFVLMKIKDVNSCNSDRKGGGSMVILKTKYINFTYGYYDVR